MSAPFSYELITSGKEPFYRVRDAQDNKLATCYVEQNAFLITEALNYQAGLPVNWTCGHIAAAHCAECYRQLANNAHVLTEQLDTMAGKVSELEARNAPSA